MKTRQIALDDKISAIQQLTNTGWKTLGLIEDGVTLKTSGTCEIEYCNFKKGKGKQACEISLENVIAKGSTFQGDCLISAKEPAQVHKSFINSSLLTLRQGTIIRSEVLKTEVDLERFWAFDSEILACEITGNVLSATHSGLSLYRGKVDNLTLTRESLLIQWEKSRSTSGLLPPFFYESNLPDLVILRDQDIKEDDRIYVFQIIEAGRYKTVKVFKEPTGKTRLIEIGGERHEEVGEVWNLEVCLSVKTQIIDQLGRLEK